jgi:hypothetical protein
LHGVRKREGEIEEQRLEGGESANSDFATYGHPGADAEHENLQQHDADAGGTLNHGRE